MSRFASQFFQHNPALLYPMLALIIFLLVFLVVIVRVARMKRSDVDRLARIPLEDQPVEARDE